MSHPDRADSTQEVIARTALLLDRLELMTEQLRAYTAELRAENKVTAAGAAQDEAGGRQ